MEINSNLLIFLSELRKSIRLLGFSVIIGTAALYVLSPTVLTGLQNHLEQQLAFFTVAGPFLAHVKLSFFVTIFVIMPGIMYCLWMALGKPFKLPEKTLAWFVLFTTMLFYLGAGFCYTITLTYGVKFPMFEKVTVKEGGAHPFFDRLASAAGTYPTWNFHKYLIGRDGQLVAEFSPRTKPYDEALVASIERAIAL